MRATKRLYIFRINFFNNVFQSMRVLCKFLQLFIVQIAFTSETISKSCVESNSDSSAISFNNVLILLRFI